MAAPDTGTRNLVTFVEVCGSDKQHSSSVALRAHRTINDSDADRSSASLDFQSELDYNVSLFG